MNDTVSVGVFLVVPSMMVSISFCTPSSFSRFVCENVWCAQDVHRHGSIFAWHQAETAVYNGSHSIFVKKNVLVDFFA